MRISRKLKILTGIQSHFKKEDMEKIAVREAVPGDAPVIAAFQLAMALETEQLMLDPEVVEKGVTAVFGRPELGCYYVAEKEGEILGSLLTTYEWSDWRNGTVLWIQSVYVLPHYRRMGVYRILYGHLREKVEGDPGWRGIRLYADKTNETAHAAYRTLGMSSDHYLTFEWMK